MARYCTKRNTGKILKSEQKKGKNNQRRKCKQEKIVVDYGAYDWMIRVADHYEQSYPHGLTIDLFSDYCDTIRGCIKFVSDGKEKKIPRATIRKYALTICRERAWNCSMEDESKLHKTAAYFFLLARKKSITITNTLTH